MDYWHVGSIFNTLPYYTAGLSTYCSKIGICIKTESVAGVGVGGDVRPDLKDDDDDASV
jgi:hypothetical protein